MKLRNNSILGKSAKTIALFLGASALSLTSCRDNDFDWESAHQNYVQKIESEYAETFEGIFGKIDPNQSWDFSKYGTGTLTRANYAPSVEGGYDGEDWYSVTSVTTNWMDDNLKEQVNNQSKGKPLVFRVPSNGSFDLIPVYQGFASSYWDMHMVVVPENGEPTDVKFWEKNQGMQVYLEPLKLNAGGNYGDINYIYLQSASDVNKFFYGNTISSNKSRFTITNFNNKKILYCHPYALTSKTTINYSTWKEYKYKEDIPDYKPLTPKAIDGLKVEASDWCQFYVAKNSEKFELTSGEKYYLEADIKANSDCNININVQVFSSWSKMDGGTLSANGMKENDTRTLGFEFTASNGGDHNIIFQPQSPQNFTLKNIRIYKESQNGPSGFLKASSSGLTLVSNPNQASAYNYYDNLFSLDNYYVFNNNGNVSLFAGNSVKSWEGNVADKRNNGTYKWNIIWEDNINGRHVAGNNQFQSFLNIKNGNTTPYWADVQVTASEESTRLTTQSKRYTFSGLPAGATVYFYWRTKMPVWRIGNDQEYLSSLKHQMYAFGCPRPDNIPDDKIVNVVGCEAALLPGGDKDYNDMVFLLVTNEAPEFIPDPEYHDYIVEKRYMVEDLGNTDDIDFNDMVVDLKQVTREKWTINAQGQVTDRTIVEGPEQTATIRAMGGTLDFEFFIGETSEYVYKKQGNHTVKTMYNTERDKIDYKKVLWTGTVSGWIPNENNVSFKVYNENNPGNGTSDGVNDGSYLIKFPEIGTVPYIMAFDPSKEWRDERHPICLDWLQGKEPAQWEWPEPHTGYTYDQWLIDQQDQPDSSN